MRTPHNCPTCGEPLVLGGDMWGPYYFCDDCGWTAEDDDDLVALTPAVREAIEQQDGHERPETTTR